MFLGKNSKNMKIPVLWNVMLCYALVSGKHLPAFQRTAHLQGKAFQKITHIGLPDPEDDGPDILHLQFSLLC
jgi:hypothetical protein